MSVAPTSLPKTASYGSWRSPITSDLIVAQSIGLSEVRLDGADVYWIESRPQEQGRSVVVRSEADGRHADITPKPCNARSRVHEYGGGSWTVANGTLYFSNFADGRLYRQVNVGAGFKPAPTSTSGAARPEPLTPAPPARGRDWRFADGEIDPRRHWWIGVREDHTGGGEPVNAIVAVDLARPGADPGCVLAGGHDFFSSPRLSPDGTSLLWLAWDHPNMPWNGTTLYMAYMAQIGDSGALGEPHVVAGGKEESIFQPEWSPDGAGLVFVSDRSGWWNLYRFDLASRTSRPLLPMEAEFGLPQWMFGMSSYAFAGGNRIVCAYSQSGLRRLALLDLTSKAPTLIETPFSEFGSVRADGDHVVFRAGAPNHPTSIVALDLASGRQSILKQATDMLDGTQGRIADYLTAVETIEFPTTGGRTAFGLFYPPHNPDYAAPPDERPPLLVKCHGGPTSAASSALNLGTQYWTSRGIAVLDVNYGGSTGFGRPYRDRLHLSWGVVDVDDCVAGARFLA
ncbi:MAG: prolyl oligopeptidase family serine peptidase, partial [Xanthobacteraceae bacterium]